MLSLTFRLKSVSAAREIIYLGVIAALLTATLNSAAQDTPLISGGVAFFSQTTGGSSMFYPTIQPLLAAPIGPDLLVESRASLFEFFTPATGDQAGYNHSHFIGLSYLQGDYVASSHLTVVVGDYLIPFNTYNDRLSPIWINNFQDGPLIANFSYTSSGSGLGGMLSGNGIHRSKYSVDYNVFYSARSSKEQFKASCSFGGRASLHVFEQHLEVGLSYDRLLQGVHENVYGAHAWWEPPNTAFRLRSEFARGHYAQGYWVEADYRTQALGGLDSWIGRIEPVFRIQQTFCRDSVFSDGLPPVNTERADFGLDYNLLHKTRILTSYTRQFSSTGNENIWETGVVYRFLFRAWKGKQP